MALIQTLLDALRPQGVTRVVYASDVVSGIEDKGVDELFAEQPHLQTVVDFIAQNVAQLPLKCYIRHDDADRERDTTGTLPALLADPNPDMTGYDLIYSTVAEYALYGRAIWWVGRDLESASGWQIRLVPARWVTGWEGSNGFSYDAVKLANADFASGTATVPLSECVLFNRYRPGHPASALSPVESLKQTLAEQVEAQAFRRSVWSNATRISGYITRPAGVEWGSREARDRVVKDIRGNWSKYGSNAGGTPLLEDGMEYKPVTFNAREADWASGVKLSREDCAAAYHINPAIIWPGDGQTYASAKDNARALYADTLAPLLTMIQKRVCKDLAPMVGAPAAEYVEFDLMAKLNGNFEEQVQAMQTAVGGAWMTRQEARARMNLPREPDGDIITPLNVLVGGLASPTDTAPKCAPPRTLEQMTAPAHGGGCGCSACRAAPRAKAAPRGRKARQKPTDDEVDGYRAALESFYERQRKSVLSAMGAKSGTKADGSPEWWDAARWDSELADDLMSAILAGATRAAKDALAQLGIDPGEYDVERTRNYLRAWAEARAAAINAKTLAALQAAVSGEVNEGNQGATPAGVFALALGYRAAQQAQTIATQTASWGVMEAGRQCAPSGTLKTWLHNPSSAPRAGHERLNGETVGIRERFSNGADWPGDTKSLSANEVANCHCEVELTVPDRDSGASRGALSDANDPDMSARYSHAESYYEEVRNRSRDAEIGAVSGNSGFSTSDIETIYRHVFLDEHDLADGHRRFYPDYDMAQSWQRLRDGHDIQRHDLTLLHHELEESRLMADGISYEDAHAEVVRMGYDYEKEAREWHLGRGE